MTEKTLTENARASPQPKRRRLTLNAKFLRAVKNPRFECGGERLIWDKVEIVEEITPGNPEGDQDRVKPPTPENGSKTRKRELSIMLVLQVMILVVTVIALLVAIAAL